MQDRKTYSSKAVRKAREKLGLALGREKPLSRSEFATLLGYVGSTRNNGDLIGRIERGKRVMGPEKTEALEKLLAEHGIEID